MGSQKKSCLVTLESALLTCAGPIAHKVDPTETEMYETASSLIKRASVELHEWFISMSLEDFKAKYNKYFTIFGYESVQPTSTLDLRSLVDSS